MDVQISIRIVYMDEMMAVTSDKCNNILITLVSKLKSTLDLIIKAAKTGGGNTTFVSQNRKVCSFIARGRSV
ncbi:MAG TPA: hypothetical protein DCZ40_10030 [Lachnospiraceae bacterium]|nr:hypothetical protein [Lachnospiraceae bacterium]